MNMPKIQKGRPGLLIGDHPPFFRNTCIYVEICLKQMRLNFLACPD